HVSFRLGKWMKKPMRCLFFVFCCLALFARSLSAVADIRVAVAANFSATLHALAVPYKAATGYQLIVSPGATGALYSQIVNGAPFDVFLAADKLRPQKLEEQGLAVVGSVFVYALGVPVLWSPVAGRVDDQGAVLTQGQFRHLAIAEPRTAPYGAAAQEILQALGLWDTLERQGQLVRGSSVAQTHSQIASGAAELGFVALSQVQTGQGISGSYWLPDPALYAPLAQAAVLLRRASANSQARHFLHWLQHDPQAQRIIEAAGYRRA
ncbi:MAG: molybdate ABC transporter substrate-binding protein, partial [Haliea sp.]|nr:molybdate ABC transporter substrate-binding protein [Haliea sp.]